MAADVGAVVQGAQQSMHDQDVMMGVQQQLTNHNMKENILQGQMKQAENMSAMQMKTLKSHSDELKQSV